MERKVVLTMEASVKILDDDILLNGCSVKSLIADGVIPPMPRSQWLDPCPARGIGRTVKWAGYNWIVVHITSDRIYLASEHVLFSTPFGETTVYEDSILAKCAAAFERTLPADALEQALETTVKGMTSKVFVPTVEMIKKFDWFKNPDDRICKDTVNDSVVWWLSSSFSASRVWVVNSGGDIYTYNPAYTYGFRPFVCLSV